MMKHTGKTMAAFLLTLALLLGLIPGMLLGAYAEGVTVDDLVEISDYNKSFKDLGMTGDISNWGQALTQDQAKDLATAMYNKNNQTCRVLYSTEYESGEYKLWYARCENGATSAWSIPNYDDTSASTVGFVLTDNNVYYVKNDPYKGIKNTTTEITFDYKPWYLIDYDDDTVTLLAKECLGRSKFDNDGSVTYEGSTIEGIVDSIYETSFTEGAKTAVIGELFLLTMDQCQTIIYSEKYAVLACSETWWINTPGQDNASVYTVSGTGTDLTLFYPEVESFGVRPALKLDLSKVTFDSATNTFTAGGGDGSSYTVTIPATLDVANVGWNATDGISATGQLKDGETLTVTASSGNNFALVNVKDSDQKVGYMLAATATDTQATTSWTFEGLSDNEIVKPMGVKVEDYTSAEPGDYADIVTFTASVGSEGSGGGSMGSMYTVTITSNHPDKITAEGDLIQTVEGAMNSLDVYIKEEYQNNWKFVKDQFPIEIKGITATCDPNNSRHVIVSGTPTDDAELVLPLSMLM